MMIICTLSLAVYYPFLDNVTKFYQERFGWSELRAGRVVMIGYVVAGTSSSINRKALSSPLIGTLSDRWSDHKRGLIVMATFLFVLSHLQFFLLKSGTE